MREVLPSFFLLLVALFAWTSVPAKAAPPPVTRAQFTVWLAQHLDLRPAVSTALSFRDLPEGYPSYGLIVAAVASGWVAGFPDGTFRPAEALTREEVAKCEVLALGLGSQAAAKENTRPNYRDAGEIGRWAWGYVDEAAAIGVLRGFKGDDFGPAEGFDGAQIAHAERQLEAYLATAAAESFRTAPKVEEGRALGTAALDVTPNHPGDVLDVLLAGAAPAVPRWRTSPPAGAAAYASGTDLDAAPQSHLGVYELGADGNVVAYAALPITATAVTTAPRALALSGAARGTASASAGVGPITVQLVGSNGEPSPAPAEGVVVTLASSSGGEAAFATTPRGAPVTTVEIPPGSTGASVYYRDTVAGTPTLEAAAADLAPGYRQVEVDAGPPSRLSLTGPQNDMAGGAALLGPYSVSLQDAYGNPAQAPAGGVSVALASTAQGSHEFARICAGGPVSGLTIPAGAVGQSFYYGDGSVGSPTLSVSATGLAPAALGVEVYAAAPPAPGTPAELLLTGPPSGTAGSTASTGPFTVTLADAAGQPVAAPAGGVAVSLQSSSAGPTFSATSGGPPASDVLISPGGSSATFYYGDASAGHPSITACSSGLTGAQVALTMTSPAPASSAKVEAVPVSGKGLDTPTSPVTPAQVRTWYGEGYRVIFLNTLAPTFQKEYAASLPDLEVVLLQGYYTPAFTGETGAARAAEALRAAEAVGYPKGAYIFVDVESTGSATAQHMIWWINSWSAAVQAAGYGAGVYFGVPQPVTAAEAAKDLVATRYWRAASATGIVPSGIGVCAVQTAVTSSLDEDTLQLDARGDSCIGAGR